MTFNLVYTGFRRARREVVRADLDRALARKGSLRLLVGFDPERQYPPGGDLHAYEWGLDHPGEVAIECRPAFWGEPALGKGAGLYRNGCMLGRALTLGNCGVLVHVHPDSRGANGTARYAELLGLPVRRSQA